MSTHVPSGLPSVKALIRQRLLKTHFQPIVDLVDGHIHGYEALTRPPVESPWKNPDELFMAARQQKACIELEIECVRCALTAWAAGSRRGRLFVNFSASALVVALEGRSLARTLNLLSSLGVAGSSVVIELTEHEQVRDVASLIDAVALLRRHGVEVALDDYGDGHSSLRLWSELKPSIVKIDKYFTRGLHDSGDKLQTFRALLHIAETFGTQLVAEGIETPNELHVLRDLGVRFGQGFVLGRPAPEPAEAVRAEAAAVLQRREVAVFPQQRRVARSGFCAASLMLQAPTADSKATHDDVMALLEQHPALGAVALLEEGRPVALVNRQRLVAAYLKPFFREIYGRRPVVLHACTSPRLVDLHAGIEELTDILTSSDQRYLTDGFVITEGGLYRGMGTGEQLVRAVTEARIEAARYANPLTFLPGNIPINNHIERLLDSGGVFVACYADLNNFKPFNDVYGYWRGDEMIRLAANVLTSNCDAKRDFVGHVGGDDFIVLFQSQDWSARCKRSVEEFNRVAKRLYDLLAQQAGGIEAEDRHGVVRFHPCTTMSIGAVRVDEDCFRQPEDVANAAAAAKRQAKQLGLDLHVLHSHALRTSLATTAMPSPCCL